MLRVLEMDVDECGVVEGRVSIVRVVEVFGAQLFSTSQKAVN